MTYTPTDITLLIGAVSTACASLFLVIQRSRCTTVKCFGVHCERTIDDNPPESLDAITTADIENQLARVSSPTRTTREIEPVLSGGGHVLRLVQDLERGESRQTEHTRPSDTAHG